MRRYLAGAFALLILPLVAAQQLYVPPFTLPASTCTNQFLRSIAAATGVGTCATVSLTADVTGVLPAANGGAGTINGALKANGSGLVSASACADLSNGGAGCTAALAAQSDQETGTSTTTFVSPARQQFHPSSPKAWVAWTGSTGATLAAYNVSSVTRGGTGIYTINFTTSFSSTSYACVGGLSGDGTNNTAIQINTRGTGTLTTSTFILLTAVPTDPTSVYVVCYGDQ